MRRRGCGGALPLWKQLGPRRALMADEGTQCEDSRVCVAGMLSDRALLRVPVTKETTHPAQVPLHWSAWSVILGQSSLVCSFRLLRVGGWHFEEGTNAAQPVKGNVRLRGGRQSRDAPSWQPRADPPAPTPSCPGLEPRRPPLGFAQMGGSDESPETRSGPGHDSELTPSSGCRGLNHPPRKLHRASLDCPTG